MKIRRFLSVFLLTCLLCTLFTPQALALEDPDIHAKAAILVDGGSGTVLYDKNIHEELPMASITKVMSALLVLEAIDRGQLRMDQEVTASQTSMQGMVEDGSTADIKVGETLTVEQLLYCMLVISANETCNILGEAVSGTVDAFVAKMNQRAQELGCKNTHFANTTGLTQSGHYSSAWDIYLITREAMKHDVFMTIVNTKAYTVPATNMTDKERELHSTNALISNWRMTGYLYSGAQGIKTGTTDAAVEKHGPLSGILRHPGQPNPHQCGAGLRGGQDRDGRHPGGELFRDGPAVRLGLRQLCRPHGAG